MPWPFSCIPILCLELALDTFDQGLEIIAWIKWRTRQSRKPVRNSSGIEPSDARWSLSPLRGVPTGSSSLSPSEISKGSYNARDFANYKATSNPLHPWPYCPLHWRLHPHIIGGTSIHEHVTLITISSHVNPMDYPAKLTPFILWVWIWTSAHVLELVMKSLWSLFPSR